MNTASTAGKLANVAKFVAQQARRNRLIAAAMQAIATTVRSFARVAHQLFLEVAGVTFLALAGIGVIAGLREYAKLQSGQVIGRGRLALAICFTLSFVWFGLTSFWRVRRVAGRKQRQA